jgi:hypothetical protein
MLGLLKFTYGLLCFAIISQVFFFYMQKKYQKMQMYTLKDEKQSCIIDHVSKMAFMIQSLPQAFDVQIIANDKKK